MKSKTHTHFPNSRIEKMKKNSCPLPPSRINKNNQNKIPNIKKNKK
jgi:hypothetical protein